MSIDSSLLYTREDGSQDFVHDKYRDFFLARYFAQNKVDITPLATDGSDNAVLFYANLAGDTTDLVGKMIGTIKSAENSRSLMEEVMQMQKHHATLERLLLIANCIMASNHISEEDKYKTLVAGQLLELQAKLIIPTGGICGLSGFEIPIESIFFKFGKGNESLIEKVMKYCDGYVGPYGNEHHLPLIYLAGIAGDSNKALDYLDRQLQVYPWALSRKDFALLAESSNEKAVDIVYKVVQGRYGGWPEDDPNTLALKYTESIKLLLSMKHPKVVEVVKRIIETAEHPPKEYFETLEKIGSNPSPRAMEMDMKMFRYNLFLYDPENVAWTFNTIRNQLPEPVKDVLRKRGWTWVDSPIREY